MTRDLLIAILSKWVIQPGVYCDKGPHSGMMLLRVSGAYVTPGQMAELQKDLAEYRQKIVR